MNRNDTGQQPQFAPQGPAAYRTPGSDQVPAAHAPAPVPQPRKSWFARHKILTAVLAVVVLAILVNALGGEDDPAPATGTVSTTDGDAAPADQTTAEPSPVEDSAGIGDAVTDGKFAFTVTGIETGVAQIGDEWLNEKAQGQFVLVHVTVSNVGDRAQMFHGSNQTLVDDQGRQHSADTSAAIYLKDADSFLNDINPGNAVDAVVVFDIPVDAEPTVIELHDSMFSGGVSVSLTD